MISPPIAEFQLLGAYEAGVPNRERIVLRPLQAINLSQYAIVLTVPRFLNRMVLQDSLYWFPEQIIAPPAWVFLYTGPGHDQLDHVQGSTDPAHVFHWGKPKTLFAPQPLFSQLSGIAPTLIRVSAITNGQAYPHS